MTSKWYSGHYPVTDHKHLHYLFIESEHKPETDPVLVFFNGGPGGASITLAFRGLGTLMSGKTEEGLFNLTPFNNSWCSNASLIFLDNPAGVGFSYAERKIDDFHNDLSFEKDGLAFMK